MAHDQAATKAERSAWLARLEVDGKVKSSLLTAIVDGDTSAAIHQLQDGNADARDLRSRAHKNLPTGLTALHLAAMFGDDELVKSLLDLKANPKITCYCQITSQSVATKFWMDARPLLFAVGAKNKTIVGHLLSNGAPATMDDAWPLYSAEWWHLTGRFDWHDARSILELLVEAGLNINQRAAKIRWSYLHYVVNLEPRNAVEAQTFLQARYETIESLLDKGADPLLKDNFGRTVWALLEDREASVRREGALTDAQQMKLDADGKLKQLLIDSMRRRLTEVRQSSGFKGSIQRLALQGQSLDRLPLLLRSGASSLRRISLGSSTNVSLMEDLPARG